MHGHADHASSESLALASSDLSSPIKAEEDRLTLLYLLFIDQLPSSRDAEIFVCLPIGFSSLTRLIVATKRREQLAIVRDRFEIKHNTSSRKETDTREREKPTG